MKNGRFIILFAYVALIHCILLLIVASPSIYTKISYKINNGLQGTIVEYSRASLHTMLKRKMQNIATGSTIFIGDSLVQGLNTATLGADTLNLGIGHDQTVDVLKRLQEYPNINLSNRIIVHVGINDIRNEHIDDVKQRFVDLITYLTNFKNVQLEGIFPVSNQSDISINKKINLLNQFVEAESNKHPNIHFVSPPAELFTIDGQLKHSYHIGDGLHLNKRGNEVWLQHLRLRLNE